MKIVRLDSNGRSMIRQFGPFATQKASTFCALLCKMLIFHCELPFLLKPNILVVSPIVKSPKCIPANGIMAVVVAQLVEQSLLAPEI